jgi:hypothetical protein
MVSLILSFAALGLASTGYLGLASSVRLGGAVSGHTPVASGARHHACYACISLLVSHFWVVSFCDPF